MKHNNKFYLQLSRELFTEEHQNLHMYAKWIFVVLNELEQKYTGKKEDFFFRSDDDLARDCGISSATLKRYKKQLIDSGFIQHWNMHYIDKKTGKKSEKKVSAYRILK